MAGRARIEAFQPVGLAPPAGHYAHAVMAGGLVFVSGQLPIDGSGRPRPDAPFADQVRLVLGNVDAALTAAGTQRGRLVQVRVYVTDIGQWPAFNALYAEWIGAHRPARAVVPVPVLHHGCAVEVEGVACGAH